MCFLTFVAGVVTGALLVVALVMWLGLRSQGSRRAAVTTTACGLDRRRRLKEGGILGNPSFF